MAATRPAIRPERPADASAIRALLIASFGGSDEADLVEGLRRDDDLIAALVAEDAGAPVGHVAASPVSVAAMAQPPEVAALAPVAVAPERQRHGIGTELVCALLDALAARGIDLVLVLGDPAWYRRFGFASEAAAGLAAPFAGPHLMALEIAPGAAARIAGRPLRYAPAFAPFLPPA